MRKTPTAPPEREGGRIERFGDLDLTPPNSQPQPSEWVHLPARANRFSYVSELRTAAKRLARQVFGDLARVYAVRADLIARGCYVQGAAE